MGPLDGIRVVELAGIGPGPFGAMLLADMGAEVLRVDRVDRVGGGRHEGVAAGLLGRGRRSVAVDLKHPAGVAAVLRLVEHADALIEGFRPGVTERLGLGPEVCLARNPRLIYGRMTGWGQQGPLAGAAGHDINYIALAGVLHAIGRAGQGPVPPLNLAGDFGGGGLLLAFGIACALVERSRSGQGQVIDAAMVDGAALLMTAIHELRAAGAWTEERGTNLLDGGAPFYDVYETRDGKYVAIGPLEPPFYDLLLRLLRGSGLAVQDLPAQYDRRGWPRVKARLAEVFRTKSRDEWCRLLEGTDVCFAPVLSMSEAYEHPHNVARGTFVPVDGVPQPAPAPRFSRTPGAIARPPARPGQHTDEALADWGFSAAEVRALRDAGAVA